MAETSVQPKKPKTLERPLRKRVKRMGKKVMRWAAAYQARQGTVPDVPFQDPSIFPALKAFEDHIDEIRAEAQAIVALRDHIPGFQEISPDQYRIAKANNWKTFVLFGFGDRLEKNCRQAPVTASLLEKVPNIQLAMFSILAPGYHIPAHTGVTKGVLRAHLGIIIPKEREKCRIRVGDEIQAWQSGKVLVIDDTYEHEVWNETDEERVILLFDFDRPMKLGGRVMNKVLLSLMKMTAFYQEPKKNMVDFEDRFEAAARRANENLEKLADL